jgi:SAM-dependent methyltransferase
MTEPESDLKSGDRYLEVVYSSERAPKSDYPEKLARYIFKEIYLRAENLLDIGSGSGDMARAFSKLSFEVTTSDVASEAGTRCGDLDFHQVNIEKESLPFCDNQFACIFSKSVVEHLKDPGKLFFEANRVLKPGGKLIIMTPSWMHQSWGPFYVDSTHVTPFTKRSLKDMFLMHGFSNPVVKHFYQLPFLWDHQYLVGFSRLIAALPIPYQPFFDSRWPDSINKFIRFSNEVMLLGYAQKSQK